MQPSNKFLSRVTQVSFMMFEILTSAVVQTIVLGSLLAVITFLDIAHLSMDDLTSSIILLFLVLLFINYVQRDDHSTEKMIDEEQHILEHRLDQWAVTHDVYALGSVADGKMCVDSMREYLIKNPAGVDAFNRRYHHKEKSISNIVTTLLDLMETDNDIA